MQLVVAYLRAKILQIFLLFALPLAALQEESLYHASTLHGNTWSFSSFSPVISFSVSSTMEMKELS